MPTYELNGESRLAPVIVFADYYCGKFDVVIKSTSRIDGHAICAQFFDIGQSSASTEDKEIRYFGFLK